jgi:hypothetical protein
MARKKEAKAAQPIEKVKTKGSLYEPAICIVIFIFFSFYEWNTINLMLDKGPFTTPLNGLLFVLAMLLDFAFVSVLGLSVVFNLVSRAIGSYPKDSFLLKADDFLSGMLWWLIGGLLAARVALHFVIASEYPISAWDYHF